MWGSTACLSLHENGRQRCPARVGICHTAESQKTQMEGLPCSRGDLPGVEIFVPDPKTVAPQLRGSTEEAPLSEIARKGFPARAGICHGFWKRPVEWYSCPVVAGIYRLMRR